MRIYTIGHGSRRMDDFLDLLCRHGVTHLVDVRGDEDLVTPVEYQPESLKVELLVRGIMYANMSSSLGRMASFSPEEGKKLREMDEFSNGLQKLIQVAMDLDRTVCIMGVFASAERCHRCTAISEALIGMRATIKHIEDDEAVQHELVMGRLHEQAHLGI
jgi:uncharacterized protein (DUF488 family)